MKDLKEVFNKIDIDQELIKQSPDGEYFTIANTETADFKMSDKIIYCSIKLIPKVYMQKDVFNDYMTEVFEDLYLYFNKDVSIKNMIKNLKFEEIVFSKADYDKLAGPYQEFIFKFSY